jgi:hypothetical protein
VPLSFDATGGALASHILAAMEARRTSAKEFSRYGSTVPAGLRLWVT